MKTCLMNACVTLAVFTLVQSVSAAERSAEPFARGDRVAFIGDSITHGGNYHAVVYDFYLTRFPENPVRFYNCGTSGDVASRANGRYDWDIAPKRATAATIMLAMNDVNRGLYGIDSPSESVLSNRASAIDSYTKNMDRLVARLVSNNIRTTIITPSPYDQTSDIKTKNLFGVNDALSNCGEIGRSIAARYGCNVIDFNGPMTALNIQIQRTNKEATIIGADRVHPGELGNFLMAYLLLTAQGMNAAVAEAIIDVATKEVTAQKNCTVGALSLFGGVSFSYLARSLPMPVTPAYTAADALVPVTTRLNIERIAVLGLADGTYTLSADGTELGSYSANDLATGVNIATNTTWANQAHARIVHKMNWDRLGAERMVRDIRLAEYWIRMANVDITNEDAVNKYIDKHLEQTASSVIAGFYRSVYSNYRAKHDHVDEYMAKAEKLMDECYATNHPISRTFTIRLK